MLKLLERVDFRKVRPDFVVGLARQHIRIAQDAHSAPLNVKAETFVRERPYIVFEICRSGFRFGVWGSDVIFSHIIRALFLFHLR